MGAFVYITQESMNLMRVVCRTISLQMHYEQSYWFRFENQLHLNVMFLWLHPFVHKRFDFHFRTS